MRFPRISTNNLRESQRLNDRARDLPEDNKRGLSELHIDPKFRH
jgi:hypothetical protein